MATHQTLCVHATAAHRRPPPRHSTTAATTAAVSSTGLAAEEEAARVPATTITLMHGYIMRYTDARSTLTAVRPRLRDFEGMDVGTLAP
jgi:hypothetical protein